MPIANWTDADYALAAIDMLPEDPEMIGRFLKDQGVSAKGRCDTHRCPVSQWINKWVDGEVVTGREFVKVLDVAGGIFNAPTHVSEFIRLFDGGHIRF